MVQSQRRGRVHHRDDFRRKKARSGRTDEERVTKEAALTPRVNISNLATHSLSAPIWGHLRFTFLFYLLSPFGFRVPFNPQFPKKRMIFGNADVGNAIEVRMKRFPSTPAHHTDGLNPGGLSRQFNGLGWSDCDSLFKQLIQTLNEVDQTAANRAKNGAGGLRPRHQPCSIAKRMNQRRLTIRGAGQSASSRSLRGNP